MSQVSGKRIPGAAGDVVLEDAPGRYVMTRFDARRKMSWEIYSQISEKFDHFEPGDELGQLEGMRADIADASARP